MCQGCLITPYGRHIVELNLNRPTGSSVNGMAVTAVIGLLTIGFGSYTFFLRATNPLKLRKLKPMQDMWESELG